MLPSVGKIVKLNQDFINDVRSKREEFKTWMKGSDDDYFVVRKVEKTINDDAFSVSIRNLRTYRDHRITVKSDGKHAGGRISKNNVFNYDYSSDDVCKKCGILGEIIRTACICRNCGNTIWGC